MDHHGGGHERSPQRWIRDPGGGGLQYEMPGCVCWGSEYVPIKKDALCQKIYPY